MLVDLCGANRIVIKLKYFDERLMVPGFPFKEWERGQRDGPIGQDTFGPVRDSITDLRQQLEIRGFAIVSVMNSRVTCVKDGVYFESRFLFVCNGSPTENPFLLGKAYDNLAAGRTWKIRGRLDASAREHPVYRIKCSRSQEMAGAHAAQ